MSKIRYTTYVSKFKQARQPTWQDDMFHSIPVTSSRISSSGVCRSSRTSSRSPLLSLMALYSAAKFHYIVSQALAWSSLLENLHIMCICEDKYNAALTLLSSLARPNDRFLRAPHAARCTSSMGWLRRATRGGIPPATLQHTLTHCTVCLHRYSRIKICTFTHANSWLVMQSLTRSWPSCCRSCS